MRSKTIWLFLALILVSDGLAYSTGYNTSLTEFGNFTNADNFLEITQEINGWLGYGFGNIILLLLGVIFFGVGLLFANSFSKVFLFASFMLSLTAMLLKAVSLITDLAFYFCLSTLVVALFTIIIKKGD